MTRKGGWSVTVTGIQGRREGIYSSLELSASCSHGQLAWARKRRQSREQYRGSVAMAAVAVAGEGAVVGGRAVEGWRLGVVGDDARGLPQGLSWLGFRLRPFSTSQPRTNSLGRCCAEQRRWMRRRRCRGLAQRRLLSASRWRSGGGALLLRGRWAGAALAFVERNFLAVESTR